ncbi:MAG: DNA translocase FtsK, partial [bacterium]|nr:DNA translocase FtsK [bacterium]
TILSFAVVSEWFFQNSHGGGLVGGFLFTNLSTLISETGVVILSFGGLLMGFVIILDRGIEGFFLFLKARLSFLGKIKTARAILVSETPKAESNLEIPSEENYPIIKGEPDNFEVIEPAYGNLEDKTEINTNFDKNDNLTEVDRGDFFQVIPTQAEPNSETHLPNKIKSQPNKIIEDLKVINVDKPWKYPTLDLLENPTNIEADRGDVNARAKIIEKTLGSFGIKSKVVEVHFGPAVTQYALETQEGTKITKINNLHSDLAMSLASPTGTVRIEAPIPGKSLIGIEVPNFTPSLVTMKSILKSDLIKNSKSKLVIPLGRDVSGDIVVGDIAKMPHALIAGATGSGKSILVHSIVTTLLFRCSPEECKFIMIDPKRVELKKYEGVPHLLTPIIVDPEKALPALKWAVDEMTKRYKKLEELGVRDIESYNQLLDVKKLPFIIIVVDEFADLMATSSNDVEKAICRIAQMARAVGIHLILATQRPSVDVLTGLIKANIPTRIALNVSSQTDSRVIMDQTGAEKLLGKGDMLYVPPESSKPKRVQSIYVSEKEIGNVVKFIKDQGYESEANEKIMEFGTNKIEGLGEYADDYFPQAVKIVVEEERASASLLQRRLSVGYARAARLLDELEEKGIISEQTGSKAREVYIKDAREILGDLYEASR